MMMEEEGKLAPNSIAFIALATEYCREIKDARESDKETFINSMLKLLPRIYISATDLSVLMPEDEIFIDNYLDEDYYENLRRHIETLMGPDDVYLEVFESDMKYSDTPIGVSIAETLADIYQDLYNFVVAVKDVPTEQINDILAIAKENFEAYWGLKLCNVLRALHHLKYNND